MADWIALDENTQKALRDALGPNGEIRTAQGSALQAALNSGRECVILLPSSQEGYARLVTLERPAKRVPNEEKPVEYEATGFLGLVDMQVSEDEPAQPGKKKSWWKKLVE